MKTVAIIFFYTIAVWVLMTTYSCGRLAKCEGKQRMDYKFMLPIVVSPAKDTFQTGDTIWIENTFSAKLVNQQNNKTYDVSKVDFKTVYSILDLNSPKPASSYIKPQIITYKGETGGQDVTEIHQAIHIKYVVENGELKYKAAFIPQKSGLYLFEFFTHTRDKTDVTECANESWELQYVTNGGGANNYSMIKHSVDPDFATISLEEYTKFAGYCFYVK